MTQTPYEEALAFLFGEGPLDGVWFGDEHPTERGAFWWRKNLRALISPPEPTEPVAWCFRSSPDFQWHLTLDAEYAEKARNCGNEVRQLGFIASPVPTEPCRECDAEGD